MIGSKVLQHTIKRQPTGTFIHKLIRWSHYIKSKETRQGWPSVCDAVVQWIMAPYSNTHCMLVKYFLHKTLTVAQHEFGASYNVQLLLTSQANETVNPQVSPSLSAPQLFMPTWEVTKKMHDTIKNDEDYRRLCRHNKVKHDEIRSRRELKKVSHGSVLLYSVFLYYLCGR